MDLKHIILLIFFIFVSCKKECKFCEERTEIYNLTGTRLKAGTVVIEKCEDEIKNYTLTNPTIYNGQSATEYTILKCD